MKLLVAEDELLVRCALVALLESTGRFKMIHQASNGKEAIDQAVSNNPDIILMDIRMPVLDGIESTKHITGKNSKCKILFLTTIDDSESICAGMEAGAHGWLLKDSTVEQILTAVDAIATGSIILGFPHFKSAVPRSCRSTFRAPALTQRESEILRLIGNGIRNNEIAEVVGITRKTVRDHVGRLLAKFGARSRVEVAIWAQSRCKD